MSATSTAGGRGHQPSSPAFGSDVSLAGAAREFWRHPTPWLIVASFLVVAGWRVSLGGWRTGDTLLVVGLVALQPFVEWVIHTALLHWRPRVVLGRTVDPLVSRKHREHHADPRRIDVIFIPTATLLRATVVVALAWFLLASSVEVTATGLLASSAITFIYEWTHFLIHSDYKPRSRLYRYIWRSHRLHHFKNERYWFGVTNPLADHVLGTYPERDAVVTSPTCRDLLGGDRDAA